jgi:WxL interacting protein linking bacterial and host surfaces
MSRSRATAVRRRVTVAVLTVGIAAVGTASTASAVVPPAGTFTVRSVNADPNDPTVHPYFRLSLGAGQSTTQHVQVGNPSDSPVTLFIDSVEGRTGQTSGAVYANRRDLATRAAAKWVTPATTQLTVAPHTSVPVAFTVTVPAGAHGGDHLAGLAVQNTNMQVSGNGFKVREVLRTVVGVLITVPGTVSFHPLVISAGIAKLPGPNVASVSVAMANDGRALGKPDLKITVTGPNRYSRTVNRTLDTLLPADVITYPYAWPDSLASGKYAITVWLTGGGTTAKYQTTVTLGVALRGVSTSAVGSDTPLPRPASGGMPWAIIVVVGLVGVAGGLLLRWRPAFLRRHQSLN